MAIAETVKNYLTENAIDYNLPHHTHSGSSHESAEAAHVQEDHIAKGVIVKDASGYAMVVLPANDYVEMKRLRKELNRDIHLATEDELATLFGDCETGAIPPLGPAYGIDTILDQALASLANVYFEAGDHMQLIHTAGDDFRTLLGGARHGYFSHEH